MTNKSNIRVTVDIPTTDHKKCHEPNEITQKALESVRKRIGLKKAATVEELFKKLGQ